MFLFRLFSTYPMNGAARLDIVMCQAVKLHPYFAYPKAVDGNSNREMAQLLFLTLLILSISEGVNKSGVSVYFAVSFSFEILPAGRVICCFLTPSIAPPPFPPPSSRIEINEVPRNVSFKK